MSLEKKHKLTLLIIFLVVLFFSFFYFVGTASAQEIMPLSGINKGDKGYGLTVFEGTTPERFDFEVLGIFDNGASFYILVELSGGPKDKNGIEIIKKTKILSGMSGTPMYTNDGKIIGGLAIAPRFSLESKGFITPIEYMVGFKPKILTQPNRLISSVSPLSSILNYGISDISPSPKLISAGEMYYFCEYWGDDYSCSAGTVTLVDSNDPSILYTLGHESGQIGLRAIPIWKAEVLTSMARLDSSNKVARKVGPIIGTVVFNGPFGQVVKLGTLPRFFPLSVVVENYFTDKIENQYFLAYNSDSGTNVASIIASKRMWLSGYLDVEMETRIDVTGLNQIRSFGGSNKVESSIGTILDTFITAELNPVIESVKVVLKGRSKYKVLNLKKVSAEINDSKDDNLHVALSIIAVGEEEWTGVFNMNIDGKYLGKKLYVASGNEITTQILKDLPATTESVELLNKVADKNAVYVFFMDKDWETPKSFNTSIFFTSNGMANEIKNPFMADQVKIHNSKHSPRVVNEQEKTTWKNSVKKLNIEILAKVGQVDQNYLINGKQEFIVILSDSSIKKTSNRKKRFLFF